MVYFVVGWLAPWHGALVFYLFFVPAVALQWQFNANACVLNNLESWLRNGQWRDPANREEGAWLASLAEDYLRFRPGPLAVEIFTYGVLLAFWAMALIHLLYFGRSERCVPHPLEAPPRGFPSLQRTRKAGWLPGPLMNRARPLGGPANHKASRRL